MHPRDSGNTMELDLDTSRIKDWRSIVTLIVFVLTNIVVLFPFHIPLYIPRLWSNVFLDALSACRIIPPRQDRDLDLAEKKLLSRYVVVQISISFSTAPLVADLFLLAILAIGRQEVHDGTVGANHINPIDIMVFFITLAYIAISIDASGLIRYLAFKVLQKGGKSGNRLFFYLYSFFFLLGSFIGNDPIILSGTAFLAYMTRVSSNIEHPRAWIHTQFAIANIASAILVSSNPTNLVLAGAFQIKFVVYTANMIVPVVGTAIVLFPFLLYVVFADPKLIPSSIRMHELSEEEKRKQPVNPNIPFASKDAKADSDTNNAEETELLSLEEIMNPFLDKRGAAFGGIIMAATLITVLAINAASQSTGEHPVFYVTLPAAVVMFCWDIAFGWLHRKSTREIARKGRREFEQAQADKAKEKELQERSPEILAQSQDVPSDGFADTITNEKQSFPSEKAVSPMRSTTIDETSTASSAVLEPRKPHGEREHEAKESPEFLSSAEADEGCPPTSRKDASPSKTTVTSLIADGYRYCQETFPTATAVFMHLPFKLVPFAFAMFVLVQALVTKGWIPVFAHGWDHWVDRTGTVGAIGGMGFISVILCNVSILSASIPSQEIPAVAPQLTLQPTTVRRHKHRHHHPPLPRHPSLAANPRQQRHPHQRPHLLGHRLQHGHRRQLRRFQHCFQRFAGGFALERHFVQEAYSSAGEGVCESELTDHCDCYGGWVHDLDWGDLYLSG
jgi:Na+/H+ antiporter NhaD/arsenite permease-like protein